MQADDVPLYQRLAAQVERGIASGALRAGDRLPSVRQLSQQHGVSMTTALQAFRHLENRGVVQARPKSGYFVAPRTPALPEPLLDLRMEGATLVSIEDILMELLPVVTDVARQYLDGSLDGTRAVEQLRDTALVANPEATLAFIERRRGRALVYGEGRRVVYAMLPTRDLPGLRAAFGAGALQ